MTETILTFPVRRTPVLCRVWFETGNPAQPLACKWIATGPAEGGSQPPSAAVSRLCLICA